MLPRKFYLDSIFDNLNDEKEMSLKCDIYEKNNIYHIEADIPGIKKEDISVEYNDGYLTIKASKNQEEDKEDKNFIRKERYYGIVERKFYIGNIKEEKINAEFNNGVLKITVPKENKETNKKIIEIK